VFHESALKQRTISQPSEKLHGGGFVTGHDFSRAEKGQNNMGF
jgi:hypothetical protein